jgi:phage gp29-like protein
VSHCGPMAAPRKYKSGAAKRKARKERDALIADGRREVVQLWSAQAATAPMKDPSKGPALELPVYGVAPPTLVAVVNSAISALEQGMFFAAAQLADGITRDDRVSAKLGERIDAITGAEMELEPAKDTARARKIAEDCEEQFCDMLPSHQVGKLLRNGRVQGVGIGQILKKRTKDATLSTLLVWNNRFLRWDWALRRYCLITENRGEIVLEPDDPEWVIYEPYGPYGWIDSAILRSITLPWLIRYWTRTWWARHQEVHGQPIRVGIIPAERDPADERLFLRQLANLAHDAVIRLPQGTEGNKFDMKLVEAAANTWEGFEKLLAHCDDSIAIAFLGQSQSTKGQGGLGSQENAGESTMLRITRSDARIYVDLRRQVLKPWAEENYGDADMAPYPCPQIEPPEDEGEAAKTDLVIGQALMAFKTAGAPVDPRKFLEARGYGELLMSPEEHAAAKQEAMEAAQQAAQGMAGDNSKDPAEQSDKPSSDSQG